MSYINTSPGSADEVVLTLSVTGAAGDLVVPALTDFTKNNANDIYTWSQMDTSSKLQIPTTATNNISGNLVVDELTYFGDATATDDSAEKLGLFGLSQSKVEVNFEFNMGAKTVSGVGYIVGLAPTTGAEAPTWQSPFTIAVSGDYTVA